MPKRATKVREIRSRAGQVLLVDSGDLFGPTHNPLKDAYVATALGHLEYDAINVGDQDCIEGIDFLLDQAKQHNLPLVSATVSTATPDWSKWVLPYRLVQVNRHRIGIIGIAPPEVFLTLNPSVRGTLTIEPVEEILARQVQSLRNRCDLIVVLSHAGFATDQRLARQVAGIDVIVGGHSQTLLTTPLQVGQTLLVQAGKNAEHLGRLTLHLQGGQIQTFTHELVPLDKRVPPDLKLKRLATAYLEQLEALLGGGQPASSGFTAADCSPCHPRQTNQWQTTAHRRAYDTLYKLGKEDNPECLSCHVPNPWAEQEGVACPTCHPVTREHGQAGGVTTVPQVTEVLCQTCHTRWQDSPFSFTEKRRLISH